MLKCIPLSAKVFALTAALVLATAATSEAQRRGGHGGGWGGHGGSSWGVSIGTPYYGAYYGHGSPYYGGYGGYGYGGYYPSYGYGSYPSYGYVYSPYNTYGSPYYGSYYGSTAYVQPSTGYQSFYPADTNYQQAGNSATIQVMVPGNAEIWFDGNKTSQTGENRTFVTPDLTPGKTFSYEVRATWMDRNNTPVTKTRTVMVQAGQRSTVNFMEPERTEIREK